MNISTLAKILGVTIGELREQGQRHGIYGFSGRNTRIPYGSAVDITKIIQPEKAERLKNDDRIYLPSSITVNDFAEIIGRPSGSVVKTLLLNGVMATLNERIDYDTASLIAEELGVEVFPENGSFDQQADTNNLNLIRTVEYAGDESQKKYVTRPPVVTIMGHVDHGKTTLLDTIRKSNVVAGEAGAITQHISGYQITYNGHKITFVDTPGHEAFTAMRARGSQLADFIILVVSAVEGPKPQTVEVIERSKLSKVPVIVAINKTDLPEADIERVKNEIAAFGLVPEEWGGETPFIPISAKTGNNVSALLDNILLRAEMSELKGEVNCPGQAVVIESHLDRNLGVVSTVLVVKDVIKVGDIVRCGELVGKIRKLETSEGKNTSQAEIGEPVMLIGIPEVVSIGEPIVAYSNIRQAQADATSEKAKRAQKRVTRTADNSQNKDNQINLILKADVSGSLEALKESIVKIPQEKVKIAIKSESIGEVTESDIDYASTTGSTLIAFHTKVSPKAENLLRKLKINLVQSNVIYELLNWVEEEILKNTEHEVKTQVLGKAQVLAIFKSEKPTVQVMGAEVKEGKILDNKAVRIWRGEEELGRGEIQQLQRNKSKVTEININQQFGISVVSKVKIQVGDTLESIDEMVVR